MTTNAIELNTVLKYIESKNINLDETNKNALIQLFYEADAVEKTNNRLSEKEFGYFKSHADKSWGIDSAEEIVTKMTNLEKEKRNLSKEISRMEYERNGMFFTTKVKSMILGGIIGEIAGLTSESVIAEYYSKRYCPHHYYDVCTRYSHNKLLKPFFDSSMKSFVTRAIGGVGLGIGLAYLGYKVFASKETKEHDNIIDKQRSKLSSEIEQMKSKI